MTNSGETAVARRNKETESHGGEPAQPEIFLTVTRPDEVFA